jgi:hypothetical protein
MRARFGFGHRRPGRKDVSIIISSSSSSNYIKDYRLVVREIPSVKFVFLSYTEDSFPLLTPNMFNEVFFFFAYERISGATFCGKRGHKLELFNP